MKHILCLTCGALVAIGFVLWVAVPRRTSLPPSRRARSAEQPAADLARGTTRATTDDPSMLSAVLKLKQSGRLPDSLRFVDASGHFTRAFAEVFALQPSELAQLDRAVAVAKDQLSGLQVAHARILSSDGHSVRFAIEPFPVEGGHLYDAVIGTCAAILGPIRGAAFAVLCGAQLEQGLGGAMGCDRMTGSISRISGVGAGWTVLISNQGDVGPTLDKMYQFDSRAAMQRELGALANLLPPRR